MLQLIQVEKQQLDKIAQNSGQSVESLLNRLEQLTWGDGLIEFRMQAYLLPWQEELCRLSNLVNTRLQGEGIVIGPNREAYEKWLAENGPV